MNRIANKAHNALDFQNFFKRNSEQEFYTQNFF